MEKIDTKISNEEKIYFNPTRTAQNGINFVTRDLIDEFKQCNEETVKDMFRLLYILNAEDYTHSPDLIQKFFDNLDIKNLSFSKFVFKV
jgi:hypothetical protein